MSRSLDYRKDIDGLRALAILAVVFYHLDMAPITGGFVGVDIFFVISGYLITKIIYDEALKGEFSYARFYEHRIRRLLPALATMLLVTSVAAAIMLMPGDYRGFSEGLASAALFLANVYYWDKTDYFGDPVENIVLLHTWSLAVEEQFYILFPPLLILLVRHAPKRLNGFVLGLFAISLLGSQYALAVRPESAFYLVQYRAWEFMAGAILATGLMSAPDRQITRDGLSLLGLGLIIGSMLWLDKHSAFPGLSALPAVLGTAMAIHAGIGGRSLAGRWLGWRPLVLVGLISYSLYLWHWPLLVFVRYYYIEPFSGMQKVLLFLASLLLAWLSWRYVESPFRRSTADPRARIRLYRFAGAAIALLVMISLPGMITRGWSDRLPREITRIEAVARETIPFRHPCFGLSDGQVEREENICTLGVEGEPGFLLWGDSHALSLAHGIDLAAKQLGLSGRFIARSLCPPALGVHNFKPSRVSCGKFNNSVRTYLDRHRSIKHVILVGNWPRYLSPDATHMETNITGGGASFRDGFASTLDMLAKRAIHVTIVEQVPDIKVHAPSILARARQFDQHIDLRLPRQDHHEDLHAFARLLAELSGRHAFDLLSLEEVFCEGDFCLAEQEGQPLYRDPGHLSTFGSELTIPMLAQVLRRAHGTREQETP